MHFENGLGNGIEIEIDAGTSAVIHHKGDENNLKSSSCGFGKIGQNITFEREEVECIPAGNNKYKLNNIQYIYVSMSKRK